MDYFDFITEEELNEIEKYDCLYTKDIISLDDNKNRPKLDLYVYKLYLQNQTNTDMKEGN